MTSANYHLCISTVDDQAIANQIARKLLQQKLVACVNISAPVTSLYLWQDEIAEDSEFLLFMKTSSHKVDALRAKLQALHPYDVAEFIVLDISDGSKDYLDWISQSLSR